MPKPDPAHKETDKILAEMEKRLDEVYKQAYKEARQTADDFMKQFREMDKKKRQQVKDGELDKAEHDRWRRTQVFQGNRYHQMADTLAADMTHTNQIAASVINGYLPEVYAVNHNYGTYEIEKGSRINTQYTMYDKQTVERLIRDNPDLLPRKAAVNVPKDQLWNKKHINSAVMQGIIQGDPIDKISQRLAATVTDMSHTSAIRNARTMTTSAQNGGRIDSYKRAESMGIKMLQVWMATLDSRTRHEHRQLDGQKRKVGEPFEVEGEKIFFPGDPAAEPYLTYNCRCTLIGEVEGVDYNLSDVSQRDNKLGDMTYEEWKEEKRKQDNAEPPAPKKPEPPKNVPEGKAVEVDMPAPTVEKPDAVDEPIIRIGNDFFTEKAAENVNVILSQMDKNTARIYKSAIESAPKEVVSDGTAYDKRKNIIGFDKSEVDTINGDIVIHETTHYMDFNTPMVYEQTSTYRTWARDENGNLLEKDGKPYKIEETETIRYDCNSVTSWISFAYEDEERQSDWEKAVSILGVNKENATPFNDWIKPDDLTARREAYRQWVKDKNISQEDLPHISDVLSSFAEGQYPFSLIDGGHDLDYWNEDVRHQYSECLAAYSVLKSRNSKSTKIIEEICPNLFKHLETGYKEMMKRGK